MDIYSNSILIGVIFVVTDCLLVYQSGSTGTTSGGPVVKAVDGKYEVIGLHRGGLTIRYNCATKFSDILLQMSGKNCKGSKCKD